MKDSNIIFNTDKDLISSYEKNLTEYSQKDIQGVWIPESFTELEEAVKKAFQSKIDIYVFSTGKNWGLGSKQPVIANSVVIDLHKLDKIIEVNERFRYVIIEPGVTQEQLSFYLMKNHPKLKFPVTGSAKGTSVMGNLLERGASAFNHRNEMIVSMEVLLTNGTKIRTGHWHCFPDNNPRAFHYSKGFGPDLRGLFTQSNLGIVTKLVLRLQPQTEGTILMINFNEEKLKDISDCLRKQYENRLIDNGIVITNLNDPRITQKGNYSYKGKWFSVSSFVGKHKLRKAKINLLKKELSAIGVDFIFLSSNRNQFSFNKSEFIPFAFDFIKHNKFIYKRIAQKVLKSGDTIEAILKRFQMIRDFYHGIPTNYSIETMAAMNNTVLQNDDLDNTKMLGLTVALPAVPFDGEAILEVCNVVNEISKKWNLNPFHNFASIEELSFEGFFRVYFDRKVEKEVETAHAWSKELNLALKEKGYLPYRLDNEKMKDFIDQNDEYWKVVKELKTTLDKSNILSKGKYNAI